MRNPLSLCCDTIRQRLSGQIGAGQAALDPESRARRVYGDFVARYPDMPRWHRERFLAGVK